MDFQGSSPFLMVDNGEIHLEGLQQSFEQQEMQQENSSSALPVLDPSSYSALEHHLFGNLPDTLSSLMEQHQQEVDQIFQLQNEQLGLSLHQLTECHLLSLKSLLETKATMILKMKEDELAMLNTRCQELCEHLKIVEESKEGWKRIAKEKEALALSLGTALQQIQQSYFSSPLSEVKEPAAEDCSKFFALCRCCASRNSCMLFLPCRHVGACKECDASLNVCPLCISPKIKSMEVFFP